MATIKCPLRDVDPGRAVLMRPIRLRLPSRTQAMSPLDLTSTVLSTLPFAAPQDVRLRRVELPVYAAFTPAPPRVSLIAPVRDAVRQNVGVARRAVAKYEFLLVGMQFDQPSRWRCSLNCAC